MLSEIIPTLMVFGLACFVLYLAYDAYKSYHKRHH